MRVKLVQKRNPQDQLEMKYYGAPINVGTITIDDLVEQLSIRSSLTDGDILNVLSNFVSLIPHYIIMGHSVDLGKLGTMRFSFSGEGVENEEDYHASMIKSKRVLFRPSPSFKERIERVRFEVIR